MMEASRSAVVRYVRTMRNKEKKRYAELYIHHRLFGSIEPDSSTFKIAYMTAQGVRLQVDRLLPR